MKKLKKFFKRKPFYTNSVFFLPLKRRRNEIVDMWEFLLEEVVGEVWWSPSLLPRGFEVDNILDITDSLHYEKTR